MTDKIPARKEGQAGYLIFNNPDARCITGQTIHVNGGAYLA